jgi:hypothetical protein
MLRTYDRITIAFDERSEIEEDSTMSPTTNAIRSAVFHVVLGVCLIATGSAIRAQESARSDAEPDSPDVVSPGHVAGQPPADAIMLFDGTNVEAWQYTDGRDVQWFLNEDDRSMTIKPGAGSIITRMSHGACQLHIEFSTPIPAQGEGQARGNSGVYLQSRYEVQILDSYENETYPDGQCGAIYGQYPPLVNVCRKPGEWQTYDIIFHPPVFDDADGKVSGGTMTVFQNGVLVQDHVALHGPTTAAMGSQSEIGDRPFYLQDHHNAVRFRNIWMRRLGNE